MAEASEHAQFKHPVEMQKTRNYVLKKKNQGINGV